MYIVYNKKTFKINVNENMNWKFKKSLKKENS